MAVRRGTRSMTSIDEIETVDLVANGELQWCIDVAFFLVTANVDVVVVRAAIG